MVPPGAAVATPRTIERIPWSSTDDFERRYVRTSTPVILTGMTGEWPAQRLWSLDYFAERFGSRLVTAGITRDGILQVSDDQGVHQVEIEFGRYLASLRGGRSDYYVLSPVDERLPELLDDVIEPEPCRRARWHTVRLWLSGLDTCSPLHRDWPENLYAQVFGRKHFLMIHRNETRRVYRRPFWSGAPNFSRLNAENTDYERFPLFRDVPRMEFEVNAGELLYIPRMWWHQVRSLEVSASINFWFGNGHVAAVGRLSQLYAKLRGLRK
jgi:lysine-specific demethylase 8